MLTTKKFFIFLSIAIGVVAILLAFQFRKAMKITLTGQSEPVVSEMPFPIPEDVNDHIFGNPGAPLSIVEFIDLGDKTSLKLHQTFYDFVEKHPGKARLVWKDFPQNHIVSGDSTFAHLALFCAGTQDRFWSFLTSLFESRSISRTSLEAAAKKNSLDMNSWQTCLTSQEATNWIAMQRSEGAALGVQASPTVFINNKKINVRADVDWPQMLGSFIEQ